jgi:cell division protein FtsZ
VENETGGYPVYNTRSNDPKNDILANKKANERIKTLQKTAEKIKESGMTQTDERANIDKLEATPAYIRKNVNIDINPAQKEASVSRLTLGSDEDSQARIRTNNAWLHDNVD